MAATFAKVFIIMTLVFELITMATGTALYPVFAAAFCITFMCLAIQFTVNGIHKISNKNKTENGMLSAC